MEMTMTLFFETEHLRIRRFTIEDAAALYEIHQDETIKKWMPGEHYEDLEDTIDAITFYNSCVDKGELPYVLAVELKETGTLIGDTGINEVDGDPSEVEIGYVISSEYTGKGYATEVVGGMTYFISNHFDIKTLYGRVIIGNTASVRVLQKNDYVFVEEEHGAEDDPYGQGMLVYKKEI